MESLSTDVLGRIMTLPRADKTHNGNCVLYVMSRDQRVADNHALFAAQQHALRKNLPFAVIFVLHLVLQKRAKEHYEFMLGGLHELEAQLAKHNIPLLMLIGSPLNVVTAAIGHLKPDALYLDYSPLSGPKKFAQKISQLVPTFIVDTHNIVPVWVTSDKQEYGARTIRPKIYKHLLVYAVALPMIVKHPIAWPGVVLRLDDLKDKISAVVDETTPNNTILNFDSGETAAKAQVAEFIAHGLKGYATHRNDPSKNNLSNFSPYLHFGQVSSLYIYLQLGIAIKDDPSLQDDVDALVEEMIIRKELSDNYCHFNSRYDTLLGAPSWALNTLQKHQSDKRQYVYTYQQFCDAQTHDMAWNAAQNQLRKTGKIHGYMRMYWAKKVLEWTNTPKQAHDIVLRLNDFYSIDGGDPNGYAGILWSVAGLHDRPWGERAVYGTVRSMVYAGLKRKFDIATYIANNN